MKYTVAVEEQSKVQSKTISKKDLSSSTVTTKSILDNGEATRKKRMKIADEEDGGLVVHKPSSAAEIGRATSSAASRMKDDELAFRGDPNTSYIYCSQAQQVTVTTTSSAPETIALLIPSNVLNSTANMDPSLLEISCQVSSRSLFPLPYFLVL